MSHLAPNLLAGRRVLVTGGGTGLGLAMTRQFLSLGADVLICGRRAHVLETAVGALEGAFPRSIAHRVCDVRSAEQVEDLIAFAFRDRPLDILVNNAAASFIAQSESLSHRAVDAILSVTLSGAVYATLAAGRHWIERDRPGVVLSILSTSTLTGRAFTAPSAMAKSGLLAMTRSLAVEWGPRNIRLVAIAPGAFPTLGASAQLNPAMRTQDRSPSAPLGRVGRPEELAELAAFLISDAAAFMTGEMVVLDGGAHLRTSGVEDLLNWSAADWATLRAGRERS